MVLEDSQQHEIASSKAVQDGLDHANADGFSAHAREQINTVLQPGVYYARVYAADSTKFSATSRMRLSADGLDVEFLDKSPDSSIMIPADNAEVLTVGANDVRFSSIGRVVASGIHKPEVLAPSILQFDNNTAAAGSSTAAAVAVAVISLYESGCRPETRESVLKLVANGGLSNKSQSDMIPSLMLPQSGKCQD